MRFTHEVERLAATYLLTASGPSWRDYFAPDAEGLHKQGWKYLLVEMSPTDFLTLALPGQSEEKEAGIMAMLAQGTKFNSIPTLLVTMDKKNRVYVEGHEGRHRMRALRDLGVQNVPVLIETRKMTWYPGDSFRVYDQAGRGKSVGITAP
jgi:hypothetical protein